MTAIQSAKQAEQRLRAAYLEMGRSWIEVARAAKDFRDSKCCETLGYKNFSDFLRAKSYGVSTIKNLITLYERHMALGEDLGELTQSNAKILLLLPESKRYQPEVLEMAKRSTEKELWEFCKSGKNGGYIPKDHKRPYSMTIADSFRDILEETLELVKSQLGTEDDETALEAIVTHYRQCPYTDDGD